MGAIIGPRVAPFCAPALALFYLQIATRVIMAITGHKTMSMLMRYDTVGEDEILKAVGAEFEKPGTILAQTVEPEDRVGA